MNGLKRPRLRLLHRRTVVEPVYRSGISAAIGIRYGGIGSIFMFHHVVHDVSAHLNGDLYVSARFFSAWLASLRKNGVDIISMSDAVERIRDPGPRPSKRRFVVITLDDGYADNFTCALPILEKFNAPFTLYVTTDLVERGGGLWWIGLERLIARNDAIEVAPMQKRFTISSLRAKTAALYEITDWVTVDIERRAPMLRDVFDRYGVSVIDSTDEAGLSREQLRALARHTLATIGGHTTGHRDLTGLNEQQAYREISDNKIFLENLLDIPIEHFAYPYGACSRREAVLAGRAGFKTATTTRMGCLFPEHSDDLLALPRSEGDGSRMWLSFMHAQRHGVRRFIESHGGCPVVKI